jgi:hypothetical protein
MQERSEYAPLLFKERFIHRPYVANTFYNMTSIPWFYEYLVIMP